ncbi:MAG TPA: hypothetical protein EYP39_02770 [Ghiorsea sp.]|nr:hypothetical protein [Ghiorsea sp.]
MSNLARTSQKIGKCPALIVVDMINGFIDPSSPLGGHYPDVVAANLDLLNVCRTANLFDLHAKYAGVIYADIISVSDKTHHIKGLTS